MQTSSHSRTGACSDWASGPMGSRTRACVPCSLISRQTGQRFDALEDSLCRGTRFLSSTMREKLLFLSELNGAQRKEGEGTVKVPERRDERHPAERAKSAVSAAAAPAPVCQSEARADLSFGLSACETTRDRRPAQSAAIKAGHKSAQGPGTQPSGAGPRVACAGLLQQGVHV